MREAGRIEPIAGRFDGDSFAFFLPLCQLPWQDLPQKRLRSLPVRSKISRIGRGQALFSMQGILLAKIFYPEAPIMPACSGEEMLDI